MFRSTNVIQVDSEDKSNAFNVVAMDISNQDGINAYVKWTKNTPADKTFVDGDVNVSTDEVTITAHGFLTGLLVRLTTTGVLPAGLALATDFFIIRIDANTIQFATTQANATAGTPVDITAAAGGGTHTVDVTDVLAGTVDLEGSNNDIDFVAIVDGAGASVQQTIADSSSEFMFNVQDLYSKFLRVVFTITSGQATILVHNNAKGNS